LDKLVKLNNKLIRILQNKSVISPISDLFIAYNTLFISLLHIYQSCLLVYKWYQCKHTLPEIFKNYFAFNVDIHSYNTRFTNNLHLFKINTAHGLRSIKFKSPVLWNNLPQSIRNLSINEFKS